VTVSLAKPELRRELRARCAALEPHERERASAAATARLLSLPELAAPGTAALYAGTRGELDPRHALSVLAGRGARVLFPRVAGAALEFASVRELGDLRSGHRGIAEPSGPPVPLPEIDVIVVPGLGFDLEGMRLGQGGGHYDRVLASLGARTLRVGLCFERQVLERVTRDPFDQPVDLVVTDERVIRPGARRR
jgi:5-formyltetrahydrofolate cyclo-ligase